MGIANDESFNNYADLCGATFSRENELQLTT
jgi:hypothetical protein